MEAKEIREKLKRELNAQFSAGEKSTLISFAPDEPVVTFPSPTFEKPKMFEKISYKKSEIENNKIVKGIAFSTTNVSKPKASSEIYNMKEFISSNPETMSTFTYDEKLMQKQLALVKKKEWHDILFDDIDWFMQIDISSPIKKFFGGIKF